MPSATPVTKPVVFTEAIEALLVLHTPPETASVKDVVVPGHTVVVPDIVPAFGSGLTAIADVAVAVPQVLVTV